MPGSEPTPIRVVFVEGELVELVDDEEIEIRDLLELKNPLLGEHVDGPPRRCMGARCSPGCST